MGTGYQINLSAMTQLVSTLKTAADSITSVNTALKNASADQLGNDDLNSAGGDFKDRWDYGTGKISDLTGKMTDALGKTVQAYQDVETQVAQSFATPPASSAPSPAPSTAPTPASVEPTPTPPGSGSRISSALTGNRAS
jgi:cell division septation protein DedD